MDPTTVYTPEYLAADRSGQLMRVAIVFAILEIMFVGLYFYSKLKNKTAHGLDTFLMLPAFLCVFSNPINAFLLIKYAGDGRHVAAVPTEKVVVWLKLQFAVVWMYSPSVSLPKLSIVCLYLRIFTTNRYRYAAYGVCGVIILNWVANWILGLLICTPIAYNWDKTIPGGHCIDETQVLIWVSIPNICLDLAILILPMPVIWKLNTSMNQKIGLTITFLTGSIGIVTAILRLVSFIRIDVYKDITWYSVDDMTWCIVEPGIYLIASCLPSLRPLFKHFFKDFNIRSLRSLFSSYGPTKYSSTRTGTNNSMPLSGFSRIHDPMHSSSISDGNDQKDLVACYRGSVSQDDRDVLVPKMTDLESGAKSPRMTTIMVQKEYALSSAPLRK